MGVHNVEHTQCRNADAAHDHSSVWYGAGRGGVVTGAEGVSTLR